TLPDGTRLRGDDNIDDFGPINGWSIRLRSLTTISDVPLTDNFCMTFYNPIDDCEATGCISIPLYDAPVISFVENSSLDCPESTSAELQANISGGTPPFTIEWARLGDCGSTTDNIQPIASTSTVLSNLSPGRYGLTVTDASDCSVSTGRVEASYEICAPAEISFAPSLTPLACSGNGADGAIAPNVSGGTPPYAYAWTGPGGFSSSATSISGLSAGTYDLMITDANQCTAFTSVQLDAPQGCVEICGSLYDPLPDGYFYVLYRRNKKGKCPGKHWVIGQDRVPKGQCKQLSKGKNILVVQSQAELDACTLPCACSNSDNNCGNSREAKPLEEQPAAPVENIQSERETLR
ncbi:MAG: SprB repeat-containing protein, partial [Bacteroidota bacterium]